MRLIDADELRKRLRKKNIPISGADVYFVRQLIDNAPTVDTNCPNCDSGYAQGYSDGYLKGKEERPQGYWIYNRPNPQTGANIFRCSICNHETQSFTCGIKNPKFDNYCGNCGADMRGAENECKNNT